jgi:hypothetical protein
MRTRKIIASALAAVTAAGAVLATAGPANAERYRHRHHRDNDDAVAAAIIGGVAGLALGAALSSGGRRDRGDDYYNGYSYDPRYDRYRGGYYRYDRPRHRTCITRDRVYDPYIGRRVTIERRYRC